MGTSAISLRWQTSLAALVIGFLLTGPAYSQLSDSNDNDVMNAAGTARTLPPNEPAATDDTSEVQEIIVTGTNISGVKPVGSEAVALDREQILATGMTSPADVVRTLPQVRNLGEYREGGTQGTGNNSQQGNAINLRGLGASATLVLVDGRRVVATGAASNFTEANQVPLAALERIEVITDGASAIYGSDAVAGVVNFVLRKDFEGIEASVRMSNTLGGTELTPSITAGTHWNLGSLGAGNIIVSYEHTQRDPYLRGKNAWLRQDLRAVGGPDLRINGTTGSAGSPGNIYVSTPGVNNATLPWAGANVYYGLPASATGVGITADQLNLNDPNLVDTADFTDYIGSLNRNQVSVFFNQDLGDRVSIFAQGSYTKRRTYSRQIASFLGSIENVTVPAYLYDPETNLPDPTRPNPAYISGIPGVADGEPINVQYNFYGSSGYQNWDNDVEDYNISAGFKVRLPASWQAEGYFTYGYDNACNYCNIGSNINPDALQYLINIGTINPFSTATLSSETLAQLYGDNIQRSGNRFNDWVLKFNGPLFDLPGGTVRAAFGGEINKLENWNLNGRNKGIDNVFVIDTDKARSIGRRTIRSLFGEVYVPLVGDAMELPFMRELTLSGAIRYDDYSDVGSTTNPKIGLTWIVNDALTLRGSWGKSFRAPGLPDVNPSAISGALVFSNIPNNNPDISNDYCFGTTCLTTVGLLWGANPDTGPEKATNWSVGGDLQPVRNLKISATYYNISYTSRIVQPGFNLLTNFIYPGYPDYSGYGYAMVPINNTDVTGPNSCTIDPVLQAYLDRPILYGTTLTNPCYLRAILDGRNVNLAATRQDGIDVSIDYVVPLSQGALMFNATVNKVLRNEQQVTPGSAFVDVKGRDDQPVEWKGRGSIGGTWRGMSATLFMNYTGSYYNYSAIDPDTGLSVGPQRVKPWTTFDLNLGYSGMISGGFLKSFRASLNIQNLTDKDPPLVITSNGAFNAAYSNPYGRTYTVQITTSF